MTYVRALEIGAILLVAGALLYFWRTLRARSKARKSEELARIEARVREVLRRRDFIRARLASVQALFGHYRDQRRTLSHEIDRLQFEGLASEPRDASFAELVDATLRLRMLGLADVRQQLPYLLSLIAYESDNLQAEMRFVTDEADELQHRIQESPRLAMELTADVDGVLREIQAHRKDFVPLRDAVQDELRSLPGEREPWRRLEHRRFELELLLAREQRGGVAAFAMPSEKERGLASPPPDFKEPQLRQQLEEAISLLRSELLKWASQVVPELTDSVRREWESEVLPRLAERLDERLTKQLAGWRMEEVMRERKRMEGLERERKRTEERLSALEAPHAPRDPVLLQSLWPRRIRRAEWQTLLVYIAAGSAALAEAEADAQRRLRAPRETYEVSGSAAHQPISRGTLVTVTPELASFRFNPPSATLEWLEDWQCAEFRMQALPEAEPGRTFRGRIAFFVGPLLIGENELEIEMESEAAEGAAAGLLSREPMERPLPGRSLAPAYRSIFVSYAHTDSEIVDRLQAAYRALGDSYFRDVEILRSGEQWSPALLEKIREADIFQLCWSEAAQASCFIEQEWRHALQLEREHFVRPMYWRKPLPNPPAELAGLHFKYVEMALP